MEIDTSGFVASFGRPRRLSRATALTYAQRMDHVHEDSALMLQYCDGDVHAFETLYRRHNDALYRYLLRLSFHRETAEDVFQETWRKIIKARSNYRPTAAFRTFLFRVAHNCFIDHCRRNRRHDASVDVDPDTQHAQDTDLESETERGLARRRLMRALRELPDEQRDAWLLHEEGHFSVVEIAAITGVNPETAKSRLRYAVAKLRTAMTARHPDNDAQAFGTGDGPVEKT